MADDQQPAALLDLVASFLGPATAAAANQQERASPAAALNDDGPLVGCPAAGGFDGRPDACDCTEACIGKESQHAAARGSTAAPLDSPSPRATVVVFSRDRPWQLRQLLRSMSLSPLSSRFETDGPPNTATSSNGEAPAEELESTTVAPISLDIVIIARVDGPYEEGYRQVEAEFGGTRRYDQNCVEMGGIGGRSALRVRLVREGCSCPDEEGAGGEGGNGRTFERLLEDAVYQSQRDCTCSNGPHPTYDGDANSLLMFLTDDCLFLEPIGTVLRSAASCLLPMPASPHDEVTTSYANARRRRVLSYVARLHPAVTWCQTRGLPCPPPRNEMVYFPTSPSLEKNDGGTFSGHDGGAFVFDRGVGTADWSYPFDLSGGIYRRADVAAILDWIRSAAATTNGGAGGAAAGCEGYSHPNRLEMSGNAAIAAAAKEHKGGATREATSEKVDDNARSTGRRSSSDLTSIVRRCDLNAVPSHPQLVVLAINRVQDVCSAPLALEKEDAELHRQCRPMSLVKYMRDGVDLDIERYRSTHFNSSHVGQLFFCTRSASRGKEEDQPPDPSKVSLSVLIPVHRGPMHYAAHAMISIVMQPIEELDEIKECDQRTGSTGNRGRQFLSPMQIVLVDDRCTDGSIDEMLRIAGEVGEANPSVHLSICDHRIASNKKDSCDPDVGEASVVISVQVVSSRRPGVSSALNYGLKHCTSDLVARMDADDVSSPGRLLSQARAIRAQPGLSALGTSSLLFCERSAGATKENSNANVLPRCALPYSPPSSPNIQVLRTSLPPSDPGFAAWAMLFTCSISHPSVMFRKGAIEEVGGYDTSIDHAEDYDLWNRLLRRDSRSIASLPSIGVWHRKHGSSSTSGKNAPVQVDEGNVVSARAMSVILNHSESNNLSDEPSTLIVSVLKNPDAATSASALDTAAAFLVRLESAFLQSTSLSRREAELVRVDCDARIGELASVLVKKFGRHAAAGRESPVDGAWQVWCDRCPDKNLERISLLCHAS